MFLNHIIHIGIGAIYPFLFTWTWKGILAALFIALVVQVIDLLGIRMLARHVNSWFRDSVEVTLEEWRERGWVSRWAHFLVIKLVWYSILTLAVAHVARSMAT